MATRFFFFFFFFFFYLCTVLTAQAAGTGGRFVGGRRQVKNVKDSREIQELGRYCVREYNVRQQHVANGSGVPLVFYRVLEAEAQVVAGIKYFLKISAARPDGVGPTKTFEAVVVVKPWVDSKELLNFAPSAPPKSLGTM